MNIQVHPSTFRSKAGVIVIPISQTDALPAILQKISRNYHLEDPLWSTDFKADAGEILPLYHAGKKLFLLGLGKAAAHAELVKIFRQFAFRQRQRLTEQLSIDATLPPFDEQPQLLEAAVEGLLLGTYKIGLYKTDNNDTHPLAKPDAGIHIIGTAARKADFQHAALRGEESADTLSRIFDLVNAPGNKKTPEVIGQWALDSAHRFGYHAEVWSKDQIVAAGLHALLGVNQGSPDPPAFIILDYSAPNLPADAPVIGLVGKGVTFDTGGYSVKQSLNMHFMKSDMGGAAAVLGTVEQAARRKLPLRVIGIIPSTDNSIDAGALKPGDVIGSYSGKTIEVIDTDAEGRLILADALAYITRHYQLNALVDLATLTGSCVRTLGYHAAGFFSNNEALSEGIHRAADRTGERIWRLPLWDVYKESLKSDVADVKNFSSRPVAGAIDAAKFLEVFINDHPAWAHLDIAGVAFTDSDFASTKSASGYGIRLLIDWLQQMVHQ